jgi:hypothetical protein
MTTNEEETTLSDDIDSYMESIRNLNLVVLKLTTDEEVVGVFEEEDQYSIKLIMPIKLMPTYYTLERWRPPEMNEENEEEFDTDDLDPEELMMIEENEGPFSGSGKPMYDLFNEQQLHPPIFGQDDYHFQEQQHNILFSAANSKRLVAFYHMIDWFQHTDETLISINRMTVVSKAQASDNLKHEYMGFLREKTKKNDFEIEREYRSEQETATIEEPHFGTIDLSNSQFSPYQSKFVH